MTSVVSEFKIGSGDDNIGDRPDSYKAKKGEKHRLSFVWWDGFDKDDFGVKNLDQDSPKFARAPRVYLSGIGYIIVTENEILKISGKEKKIAIATIIAKWPTKRDGSLDREALLKGDYEIAPWVFSSDKYGKFQMIHTNSGFHLGRHDVLVSMPSNKEERFQDFETTPVNDNIFRAFLKKGSNKHTEKILKAVRDIAEEKLVPAIGRTFTPSELKEKMGQLDNMASSSTGSVVATGPEVDNLLDSMDL